MNMDLERWKTRWKIGRVPRTRRLNGLGSSSPPRLAEISNNHLRTDPSLPHSTSNPHTLALSLLATGCTMVMDLPQSHLVLANITTVAGAMKKNSRWAHSSSYTGGAGPGGRRGVASQMGLRSTSVNGQEKGVEGEEELMGGFVELRWKVVESEGELVPFLPRWRVNPT